MCRFVAYLGKPMIISELLYDPINSLIAQSQSARESLQTVNGDGFGLGWYNHEIREDPGVFRSTQPAWNDLNLLHITSIIKSPCFLGHVRAASAGGVANYNCHPFHYKNFLFMHNGTIENFKNIKRRIRSQLSDEAYEWVKGQTDTEHFYALFIDHLKNQPNNDTPQAYMEALKQVIRLINDLQQTYNNNSVSYLNLSISDGQCLVAARYVSNETKQARTLHYAVGETLRLQKNKKIQIIPSKSKTNNFAVIASEVQTASKENWHTVEQNNFLLIDKNLNVTTEPITGI